MSNASGRFEVYVTPFPEGDRRWQVSIDGGRFPRWRRDGGEIVFVDDGVLLGASFRSAPALEIGAPERLISSLQRPVSFYGFGQSHYDTMPGGGFVAMAFTVDPRQGALLAQNWVGLLEEAR